MFVSTPHPAFRHRRRSTRSHHDKPSIGIYRTQPPTEEDLAIPDPEAQLVAALHVIPDWTVPYLTYMTRGKLPDDETLARQITRQSKSMTIVNGELHRCSVTGAFQCCVSPEEAREILREIHEGDCGHHAGYKSLVAKAFRHGFYWLAAHDATLH